MSTETFGEKLRQLREEQKLPLRKVAAIADIDSAILSKIEHGHRKATRKQVIKLASYFNVKNDDFMIAWLSDKLVYELKDEHIALKALQVAEEKVAYLTYKKEDKKVIFKKIADYFKSTESISKAWVFGSFARGDDDYKSDVDVMIRVSKKSPFSLFDLAEIQYQLEQLISKKVDVVMEDGVKKSIFERIKPEMKLVYEK